MTVEVGAISAAGMAGDGCAARSDPASELTHRMMRAPSDSLRTATGEVTQPVSNAAVRLTADPRCRLEALGDRFALTLRFLLCRFGEPSVSSSAIPKR